MKLMISQKIWEAFPGMSLVVAAGSGIDNSRCYPEIEDRLSYEIDNLHARWNLPNPQSHPSIAAWRTALRRVGISSDFPCAIESLVRRVVKGQSLKRINPLVDLYNAISLRHLSPVGGIDGGDDRRIFLRFTREGEFFVPLGASIPMHTAADEICYADDKTLLSRHFVWRQAEHGKIDSQTDTFLLISEVLPEVQEIASAIQHSFSEELRGCFGISPVTEILTAGTETWEPKLN